MIRIRNAAAVWLALGAIAFGALWPLLAHRSAAESSLMSEVCSVNGGYEVDLGGAGTGNEVPSKLSPHCPFCSFGGDKVAVSKPGVLGLAAPAAPLRIRLPEYDLPPLGYLLHSLARPRAPPAFS